MKAKKLGQKRKRKMMPGRRLVVVTALSLARTAWMLSKRDEGWMARQARLF